MRFYAFLFLLIFYQCSPVSRSSLEKPRLRNGFEYYSASIDSMNSSAYDSALSLVKQAIKLNPNYAKFYVLEGDIYSALYKYSDALNSYFKATKLRSSYVEIYLKIAKIYENEFKDYDEAIVYYRRSYAVEKNNHKLLLYIGECYIASGEINLAKVKVEEYKRLTETENKPLSFDYYYLSGKINFLQQNFEEATKLLEQADRINHLHFDAKLLLVKCLFKQEKLERGLSFTNDLMKINDSVGEVYYYRGLYYYKKQKFEDAQTLFEQALKLDSDLLKSHFYLGKIHEHFGNQKLALEHLQQFRQSMQQEDLNLEIQ